MKTSRFISQLFRAGLFVIASVVAIGIVPTPTASAAPADYITGLYNTGVDNAGVKLPVGTTDSHWQLVSIENPDNGQPHCQNGPFPRQAFVTGPNVLNEFGTAVWPFDPSNATWIGATPTASNDYSIACPDPSYGMAGVDTTTYPYWNFELTFNIDSRIDPSTVKLSMAGITDDQAWVSINGTQILDLSAVGFDSLTPVTSNAISGVFVHGSNTLRVHLKSAWDKTGFVISQLFAEASFYPKLAIAKTASKPDIKINESFQYNLNVTNVGDAVESQATSGAIVVKDTLPQNVTLDEANISQLTPGCVVDGTRRQITCTTTTALQPAAANNYAITVPVIATGAGEAIINTASVTGGNDPSCALDTDCTSDASVRVTIDVPNTGFSLNLANPAVIIVAGLIATLAVVFIARRRTVRK